MTLNEEYVIHFAVTLCLLFPFVGHVICVYFVSKLLFMPFQYATAVISDEVLENPVA